MEFFQDYLLLLMNPVVYIIYVSVTASAVMLFLAFYITALVSQAKKASIDQPVSLPMWLNIMYPSWLDKLTFGKIVKAFLGALGIAIISWLVLAVVFLAVLARAYKP